MSKNAPSRLLGDFSGHLCGQHKGKPCPYSEMLVAHLDNDAHAESSHSELICSAFACPVTVPK